MLRTSLILLSTVLATNAFAQDTEVSIAKGERIAAIGGCHDCHSAGFAEANGVVDPATALMGNPVGYNGPWGTTYAVNLRIVAAEMSEDEFVKYLSTIEARPPMPWFNVRLLDESETRSLHQYILSLGAPGDPAPAYVPPGETPKTPYIVFAPPVMPAS